MSKALNTYYINAKLTLDVSIKIDAKNLDDALEKSRTLSFGDFVKINGDLNDGETKITGVFE